ncbi:hypothetical protein AAMO2058_000953600 [Amorphochlora amoebiformis]
MDLGLHFKLLEILGILLKARGVMHEVVLEFPEIFPRKVVEKGGEFLLPLHAMLDERKLDRVAVQSYKPNIADGFKVLEEVLHVLLALDLGHELGQLGLAGTPFEHVFLLVDVPNFGMLVVALGVGEHLLAGLAHAELSA